MSDRKAAPTRRRPRVGTGAVLACTGILLAAVSAQAASLDGEPRLDLDPSFIPASVVTPAQTGPITLLAIPRGMTVIVESPALKLSDVAGAISGVGSLA